MHLSELLEQLWRGALGGAVHEVEVCSIVLASVVICDFWNLL